VLTYRYMGAADLDDVLDIEEQCFRNAWDMNCFLGELAAPLSHCVVCCDQGQVVAYSVYRVVVDESHLLNVAVAPSHRGKGLGKTMMHRLMEDSRFLGAHVLWLEVRPSNQVARQLYKSLGFRQVDRRPRYYEDNGEDALILALALDGRLDEIIEEVS